MRKVISDGEKEYLVVIDFIGNYKNNFLIPIALSGNAALSREALRRFVRIGSIPGSENETLIINDDGKQLPIVNIKFELDPPVNVKLYDYLTS